jgi:hypothetical protein
LYSTIDVHPGTGRNTHTHTKLHDLIAKQSNYEWQCGRVG